MATKEADVIINLGGGLDKYGNLTPHSYPRLDTSLRLFREGLASHIVAAGGWGYLNNPSETGRTEGVQGKQYLVSKGVPEDAVSTEDKSRDSIGNIVFTKQQILVPENWRSSIVVTSRSHLPRGVRIAKFVCGDGYEVQGEAAPEKIGPKNIIWEALGNLTLTYITQGIEPGDDEAIEQRLIERMPGYGSDSTVRSLAIKSIVSYIKSDATL